MNPTIPCGLLYFTVGIVDTLAHHPITLLNMDCKLAARVIASRLGPLLNYLPEKKERTIYSFLSVPCPAL